MRVRLGVWVAVCGAGCTSGPKCWNRYECGSGEVCCARYPTDPLSAACYGGTPCSDFATFCVAELDSGDGCQPDETAGVPNDGGPLEEVRICGAPGHFDGGVGALGECADVNLKCMPIQASNILRCRG